MWIVSNYKLGFIYELFLLSWCEKNNIWSMAELSLTFFFKFKNVLVQGPKQVFVILDHVH